MGKRLTQEEFIEKCKIKHNDKYDYSKTVFTYMLEKIIIICPIHGEFEQVAAAHVTTGKGCAKCGFQKLSDTKNMGSEAFLEKAISKHGLRYDYSNVKYVNYMTPVEIICSDHGSFMQKPSKHIDREHGCPKCGRIKLWDSRGRVDNDIFISKAREVHGNKYYYSKVEYVSAKDKVIIICNEHGEFSMNPNKHLSAKQGCPVCASKSYVKENILKEHLINRFSSCTVDYQCRPDWLGAMSLDNLLVEYNIAVEYHGQQHFKPIELFGGEDSFISQRERDIKKYDLCVENGVKLFYFTYDKTHIKDYPYHVYHDESELFDAIQAEIDKRDVI